ncbi:MAG: Acetyltransferase domain, partial [Pseudonocardiales bacterium]|nr:Acetyltransferase domain [Pseudonocardiales bacterium]
MPAEAVTIRTATAEDAASIQGIYAPVVLDSFASFEEIPPDV